MGGARFHVSSLSGYPISPDAHFISAYDGPKRSTEWYVHDRFNACQVVASFRCKNAEELARSFCRALNIEERRWEKTLRP